MPKKVNQIDINTNEIIKTWNKVKEAAKSMDIHPQRLYEVCLGQRISIGGFKWKYVNINNENDQ